MGIELHHSLNYFPEFEANIFQINLQERHWIVTCLSVMYQLKNTTPPRKLALSPYPF